MDLLYLLKENFKNLLFDLFINHWKKLSEFVLFIKLVVIKKLKILKNTLQRITYEALNQTLLRQCNLWSGSLRGSQ